MRTARRRWPCAAWQRPERSASRAAASWTSTACSAASPGMRTAALLPLAARPLGRPRSAWGTVQRAGSVALGLGKVALSCLQHAGAALVRPLVGADLARALVVAL